MRLSVQGCLGMSEMADGDCCTSKLDELDRLLNDPDLPLQPDLIWSLLDEVIRVGCSGHGRVVPDVAIQTPACEMVAQHPRL
jgi:hypothetical protein